MPDDRTERPRYYPGAPTWAERAVRAALPADDFPPLRNLRSDKLSVALLTGEQPGTIMVWLYLDDGTALGVRPRRGTPGDAQWLAARADARKRLEAAGILVLRETECGLHVAPPTPPGGGTEVHARREDVFAGGIQGRHHLTVPGHPHLHGRTETAYGIGPHDPVYVYGHHTDTTALSQSFRTLHDAAEAWALHCGLPAPITTTELLDTAGGGR